MKFINIAIAALGLTALLGSCAKQGTEDITRLEQEALDAWVEKYVNVPGVTNKAVRQSSGVWVQFFDDGNQDLESARDTAVWFKLHYTATDIAGNVFSTRDSIQALQQRTYTSHTNYVPEYFYCGSINYGLPQGLYESLTHDLTKPDGSTMKISKDTHVKLYIPSYMAYGSSSFTDDQGYGGQYPLGSNKIMIQDMVVREVVKNPLKSEESQVEEVAFDRWGMTPADTLAASFWLDSVRVGGNFNPGVALLEKFPLQPTSDQTELTADSTAMIWYIGSFISPNAGSRGFIFDTNIPSVHDKFYNRRKAQNYVAQEGNTTALEYKPSEDQNSFIAAFYRAIPHRHRGQWYRMVFSSSYGYGATGMSKALQRQQQAESQYMQSLMYMSMYSNSYYGGGYGGYGYGDYGYGYDPYSSYLGYSMSNSSSESDSKTIVTEIQPFTPLIFEFYIAPIEED